MGYSEIQMKNIIKLTDYHLSISAKDQIIKTIEELSSLNKMLCKYLLEEITYQDIELLDELFDANMMIISMKRLLIPDKYTKGLFFNIANQKIIRELKRWRLE